MSTWQMQAAKANLSELVRRAQREPQEITLHGTSVAVVLSHTDFAKLSGSNETLTSFMRSYLMAGLTSQPKLRIVLPQCRH
jgi:prevent-host-death family protein